MWGMTAKNMKFILVEQYSSWIIVSSCAAPLASEQELTIKANQSCQNYSHEVVFWLIVLIKTKILAMNAETLSTFKISFVIQHNIKHAK